MNWYIGPWEWVEDVKNGVIGHWSGPAGTVAAIDFRTTAQCGSREASGTGVALFAVSPEASPKGYDHIGSGSPNEIKADGRLRDLFPRRAGVTLTGETLLQLVQESLSDGDPRGEEFAKPIIPSGWHRRVCCAGFERRERFRWRDDLTTNRIRDVLRLDLAETFADAKAGRLKDSEHHRRCLDYLCERYRIADEREFVTAAVRKEFGQRLKHETVYTEDFVGANGTTIGNVLTWQEYGVLLERVSNQVRNTGNGQGRGRAESDLSSSDGYAECAVKLTGLSNAGRGSGVCVRYSGSADSCYTHIKTGGSTAPTLNKVVSGTSSLLATGSSDSGVDGDLLRAEISGSLLSGFFKGSAQASITDTTHSSGLRGGIIVVSRGPSDANSCWAFEMGDLGSPPAPASGPRIMMEV